MLVAGLQMLFVLLLLLLLFLSGGGAVTDSSLKPYYAWKLSPKVGFFMTDNRISRTLHR